MNNELEQSMAKRTNSKERAENSIERNDLFKAKKSKLVERKETNLNTTTDNPLPNYNDYDNRPIGGNKRDKFKMEEYPQEDTNIPKPTDNNNDLENENIDNNEAKEPPKRPARIKRQKPKYDARKAIEEAKLKEANKEKEKENEKKKEEASPEKTNKVTKRKNKFNRNEEENDKNQMDLSRSKEKPLAPSRSPGQNQGKDNKSRDDFNIEEIKDYKDDSANEIAIKTLKDDLKKKKNDKVIIGKPTNDTQGGGGGGGGGLMTISLDMKKDKDGKPSKKRLN